ncbi:MAG: c-type cytochrome [Polyangiaceae bacterium]|nr:c-type cytochrome [Polyangiaceae bacterium]
MPTAPRSSWRSSPPSLTAPLLLALLAAAACTEPAPSPGAAPASSSAAAASPAAPASSSAAAAAPAAGEAPDPKRGAALVERFECARCHDGLPGAAPQRPATARPDDKHCFHCHQAIRDGAYKAPKAATTERWKKNVELLCDVPTLAGTGRFRRAWVEGFLLRPVDLRPRLAPTMPRLDLKPDEARDIAAYLVPDGPPGAAEAPAEAPDAAGAAVAQGAELFEKKGCASCHAFTGAPLARQPARPRHDERGLSPAVRLAPDLRHARERMPVEAVAAWIRSPRSIKPDALMPDHALTEAELSALSRFVARAPLGPADPPAPPARLPVLERKVSYEELRQRVLNKVCWHCHSDADYAIGDGGPGNTGGFGFKPRGLNLGAYEGIASGSLDDQGERRSIFEPLDGGPSRLVATLLARQGEEAGRIDPAIRGMPLGLPALSPEEIQLVETWIAQGHTPD